MASSKIRIKARRYAGRSKIRGGGAIRVLEREDPYRIREEFVNKE
jgi:hypothetical protein